MEQCREAARILEPILLKYVVPYQFQVDYRFKAPLRVEDPRGGFVDVLLIGAMDILVYMPERDAFAIYDVKHTKDNGYWRKTMGQLNFYDLVVELTEGQASKALALFQPLATPTIKPIALTENMKTELLQQINGFVIDVVRDDLPPNQDSRSCRYCDFKHACTKFTPTIALDGTKRLAF